jgi:hypothetical protein
LERKVREILPDSVQGAYSPNDDGARIAYWKDRQYWISRSKGENGAPFLTLEARYDYIGPKWSPDGRVLYLKKKISSGPIQGTILAYNPDDKKTTEVFTGIGLLDFWWTGGLDNGRLIYSQAAASEEPLYELLEVQIDARTSTAGGEPRLLTQWKDGSPGFVSVSADGKRIVTTKGSSQSEVYVAELEQSGRVMKLERNLTRDTSSDWPTGWTKDSKGILFSSDRKGVFTSFKTGVSGGTSDQIVPGKESTREPQISPDGRWLLYMVWPDLKRSAPVRIMRSLLPDGVAQAVFEARGMHAAGITFSSRGGQNEQMKGARIFPDFRCPAASLLSVSCVFAEADDDRVSFTPFDPIEGRRGEPVIVSASPARFFWDLSPDGSRIAYGEFRSSDDDDITILTLKDRGMRQVVLNGTTNLSSLSWSRPEGRDLFVTTERVDGSDLLRVTFSGNVIPLSQETGRWFSNPRPSPDGRFLAIGVRTTDSNVWLIEIK